MPLAQCPSAGLYSGLHPNFNSKATQILMLYSVLFLFQALCWRVLIHAQSMNDSYEANWQNENSSSGSPLGSLLLQTTVHLALLFACLQGTSESASQSTQPPTTPSSNVSVLSGWHLQPRCTHPTLFAKSLTLSPRCQSTTKICWFSL